MRTNCVRVCVAATENRSRQPGKRCCLLGLGWMREGCLLMCRVADRYRTMDKIYGLQTCWINDSASSRYYRCIRSLAPPPLLLAIPLLSGPVKVLTPRRSVRCLVDGAIPHQYTDNEAET